MNERGFREVTLIAKGKKIREREYSDSRVGEYASWFSNNMQRERERDRSMRGPDFSHGSSNTAPPKDTDNPKTKR